MGLDLISFAYATTVAAGGVLGYAKSGSTISMAAGLLFGSVLGYGAYQTSVDPKNYYLSLGASAVLCGVMGSRFYKTGKIMPAGVVTILSLAMVIRFGLRAAGMELVRSK